MCVTVNDGDVSSFVVLSQCQRGAHCRRHNPNCAAAVGALQMGRGAQIGSRLTQGLRQSEGVPCAVPTVRLVPPLHHRSLYGARLELTREDHRLEEHGVTLLLPDRDMHAITQAD